MGSLNSGSIAPSQYFLRSTKKGRTMHLTTNTKCLALLVAGLCLSRHLRADEGPADQLPQPAIELATASESERFTPATRPSVPEAQRPPLSNDKNVDTGKPPAHWQRATDDWFGLRPQLDDHGITFQANLTLDNSWDVTGGANSDSTAARYLLNFNLTLNTERLAGWKGGTFFFNFQNQNGKDGSAMVGSAQGISNIDSSSLTQISELWYEQALLDGTLRLKVGKVDAGTEFARVENGAEFLNSSFGFSPTILGFPSYPNPSLSLNIFANPTPWLYGGLGIYDGATAEGRATGRVEMWRGGVGRA